MFDFYKEAIIQFPKNKSDLKKQDKNNLFKMYKFFNGTNNDISKINKNEMEEYLQNNA